MKTRSLLLLMLAALLAVAVPRPARALEVSFDFFYDSLAPHGEWLEIADYGYCWRPTGVDPEWSPYSDGYWSYTDAGWTWVSYEDFGGIVYHYGRWMNVDDEGWCWVPDYEWGPAWVSWRRSDDYLGWAPLPPQAEYTRESGISVWADAEYDIGPSYYSFCRTRDFGAPVLRAVIVRRSENVVIINQTVNITNITYNEDRAVIFNGGPSFVEVNRFVERPIPALRLVQNNNITVINNRITNNNVRITNVNSVQQGNQLVVINPRVARPQRERLAALVQPNVRRVVTRDKVNRGWAGIAPEQRVTLKEKFQQETKGLTRQTAPAKPMKVADVQVVPEKADPTAPVITRNVRPGGRGPRGESGTEKPGDPTKITAPGAPQSAAPATAGTATPAPGNPRRPTAAEEIAPTPGGAPTPANRREANRIAREKALESKTQPPGVATPAPKVDEAAPIANAPTATPPETGANGRPARNPVTRPVESATSPGPKADPTAAATEAAAKRNAAQQAAADRRAAAAAAAEAAKGQQAEEKQAARQRALERVQQQKQQQQEAAAARKAPETVPDRPRITPAEPPVTQQRTVEPEAARERINEGAQQRQRAPQQQQPRQQQMEQPQAPVQRRPEPQVRQQSIDQQAILQQRQAQQAAARQQNLEAAAQRRQQQQAAPPVQAARVQRQPQSVPDPGQNQAAAQQAAIARAQAQAAARQPARPQAQAKSAAPASVPKTAVPRKGGKPLTPEEAAALQNR